MNAQPKTYYIESRQTDPYYNLALEQVLFDRAEGEHRYFMLWQNANSIIIGKHQNTREEINAAFVRERDITVARRLSGGGAVYHDLGNLNFTFITPAGNSQNLDFSFFCGPVQKALLSMGVPVEISGRNDMTVKAMKFSGNAQYLKNNRVMHHGTILYDSNLDILSQALKPKVKAESRAVKSTRAGVTNIRPFMKTDMDILGFWSALKGFFFSESNMEEMIPGPDYREAAADLREKIYSQWDWNYGSSPPHTLRKKRRVENCGEIEIFLDVEKEGIIKSAAFYGDFFGTREPSELAALLAGRRLEYSSLRAALERVDVSTYFHALDTETFLSLILD